MLYLDKPSESALRNTVKAARSRVYCSLTPPPPRGCSGITKGYVASFEIHAAYVVRTRVSQRTSSQEEVETNPRLLLYMIVMSVIVNITPGEDNNSGR